MTLAQLGASGTQADAQSFGTLTIPPPSPRAVGLRAHLRCSGHAERSQTQHLLGRRVQRLASALSSPQVTEQSYSISRSAHTNGAHQDFQQALSESQAAVQETEEAQPALTLHYATGWSAACIHGSLTGGQWQDFPLQQVGSAPGHWSAVRLKGLPSQTSLNGCPLLEFVIKGDNGAWDKPQTGGNYLIQQPGAYCLRHGELTRVTQSPCLVVSDLDDTMVGDDAASAQFKAWWEGEAVGQGSRLVYNTGRALDSFQRLCAEKAHCMAMPDALIGAVGTKVFQRQTDGSWKEDPEWTANLDDGWHLNTVREATYHAVADVGRDFMHFRPPDEQNDHKVTCGVHASVVERVVDGIDAAISRQSIRARLILSGKGDWRFLDIVSANAGKLAALEHVRKQLGFLHEQTVACGDSGNDKDMLRGQNRAVVVGNAQPDLKAWTDEVEQTESPADPKEKHRMIVTKAYRALGILEGLEYFGFK